MLPPAPYAEINGSDSAPIANSNAVSVLTLQDTIITSQENEDAEFRFGAEEQKDWRADYWVEHSFKSSLGVFVGGLPL
jgi:hypothetical protein